MISEAPTANDQRISSLWRNRDFLLLWGGQTDSTLGSAMSGIAFCFLVFHITQSKAQVAFMDRVTASILIFSGALAHFALTTTLSRPVRTTSHG